MNASNASFNVHSIPTLMKCQDNEYTQRWDTFMWKCSRISLSSHPAFSSAVTEWASLIVANILLPRFCPLIFLIYLLWDSLISASIDQLSYSGIFGNPGEGWLLNYFFHCGTSRIYIHVTWVVSCPCGSTDTCHVLNSQGRLPNNSNYFNNGNKVLNKSR